MTVRIAGFDPSLTAFGVATREGVKTWKPPRAVSGGVERLDWFYHSVRGEVEEQEIDVVVLEGYGFMSQKAVVQGELGGVVRMALFHSGVPYVQIPPAKLKKFTTDKGNADKDAMIAAAIRKWDFQGVSNNEADAWMLYLMGMHHYNPWEALPGYAIKVLKEMVWPDPRSELPDDPRA